MNGGEGRSGWLKGARGNDLCFMVRSCCHRILINLLRKAAKGSAKGANQSVDSAN
jgi:hypothetical protein